MTEEQQGQMLTFCICCDLLCLCHLFVTFRLRFLFFIELFKILQHIILKPATFPLVFFFLTISILDDLERYHWVVLELKLS